MDETGKHYLRWRIRDRDGVAHVASGHDPRSGALCGFEDVHPMEVFAAAEITRDTASTCAACALLMTTYTDSEPTQRSGGPYVARH
jgi:hypothetical protein